MHPEIEKFWNDHNYKVVYDFALGWDLEGKYSQCIWTTIDKNNCEIKWVGKSDLRLLEFDLGGHPLPHMETPPCTIYLFEGKEYTEEEMLRIIRQKAFI